MARLVAPAQEQMALLAMAPQLALLVQPVLSAPLELMRWTRAGLS